MYEIKNQIYSGFSKNQKSGLLNFLRALVKKLPELSVDEILQKFLDDEKYYLKINSSRFEFLENIIDDEKFLNDTKKYIYECRKYYDYKKSQEPILKAQKEYEKKKREFLRKVKMQHEKPTKKQIYYYNKLCKKYDIDIKDVETLSKFDMKEEISKIIKEHDVNTRNNKNFN